MTTQHPEALRLAEELDDGYPLTGDAISAAAELRSQHARITELEAQLSAIGAGGVSPLMNAAQEATHLRELAAYRLTVENLEREIAAITSETGNPASAQGAAITSESETQPAPALWVSPEQFANFMDADEAPFGKYIPARKTSAGKFTMPLFAAPAPAQPVAESGTAYALPYKQALGSTNCMQCCVSYMMGLPLEIVPDFATDGGWERFGDFSESQGYAAVMLSGNHEFEADYLASGTTARGTSHMVVMNDGKLVHDPHPSSAGLVDVQCIWLLAKRATPRTVQADEHAEFETAAKAYTSNVSFERDGSGYVGMTAELLWHGWKIRASHGQAPATAQADTQPAHQWDVGYPPLPEQLSFDALAYAPGCAYSEAQMRAYVDADRAARAPADSVLEDAARYQWLFGARTKEQVENFSDTVMNPLPQDDVLSMLQCFFRHKAGVDAVVDAARKQGEKQ